ncbi:MAG TPA: DUF4249 domain-containing protein [Puia sp.]
MRLEMYMILLGSFSLVCHTGCKKEYRPPALENNSQLLVVDGFLTNAPDSTYITLTRSRKIADTTPSAIETNATLTVEAENTNKMQLGEVRPGLYSGLLFMDSAEKYRLVIKTAGGIIYRSDFIPFRITPEIDSLGWKEDSANVSILMNTHDRSNNTRYYKWIYEETWKYHTFFISYFDYQNDTAIIRGADHLIYYCWSTAKSSDIQLGTTDRLSDDIISNIVFHNVNKQTEKLDIEYSILAKQYSLTSDQYDYWTNLKKNTEQLGTLFDAQPSQLNSNIHRLDNPSETVLGYLCASSTTRKRIFINRASLSSYNYSPYWLACQLDTNIIQGISAADKQKDYEYLEGPGHLFTLYEVFRGGYSMVPNICGDCREHGGTSVKPGFWP